MSIFVDTSAFFALLDADDSNHKRTASIWSELLNGAATLLSSNYVLVETLALVQHRLGTEAVRTFQEDVLPVITVEWVDAELHARAVGALLTSGRRRLSLVDCVSFELMRLLGVRTALTLDSHFREQGFDCLPKEPQ